MHYVCADIHGRWEKYQAMLLGLDFSPSDSLYILGDVIDRGPDGIRILQDIMERGNIFFFMGNHELFLLGFFRYGMDEWMDLWLNNGGQVTAEAFMNLPSEEQDEISDFLEDSYIVMPNLTVQGRRYYLVHAFPDLHYMDQPVLVSEIIGEEERLWRMVWERVNEASWKGNGVIKSIHEQGRMLLIGHTITILFCRLNCDSAGRARIHHDKYFIGLDCGCGRADTKACLGVLCLENEKEYYY